MAEQSPLFETALCYPFSDFRRMIGGLVCSEGVADGNDLLVTTGGSGLNVSVAAGQAFIQGDDLADQGMYEVGNNGPVTLTATTADGTNPRIDTVVATVRDSDYGGSDNDWVLQILAGTPTVGATLANLTGAAAVPNNTIVLAYVLVPATFVGPFVDATHILDGRDLFVACGERSVSSTLWTRSTNQSIANATDTTVTYSTSTGSATPNMFWSLTSGVVTFKKAGVYRITATAAFDANATGYRELDIRKNGVGRFRAMANSVGGSSETRLNGASEQSYVAGDTASVAVRQTSGGALNITSAELSVTRSGPLVP